MKNRVGGLLLLVGAGLFGVCEAHGELVLISSGTIIITDTTTYNLVHPEFGDIVPLVVDTTTWHSFRPTADDPALAPYDSAVLEALAKIAHEEEEQEKNKTRRSLVK